MATGMTGQRHSPVGMEYEPEDKDLENIVKHHLEAFKPVVVRDVEYTDLLIHYKYFTREQRRDLSQMGKNVNSNEIVITRGLEMIDDMHDKPDRYSMLIQALEDAEYEKIVKILKGEIIPVNNKHRDHINNNNSYICKNCDPLEILPSLLRDKVIGEIDDQIIRKTNTNNGSICAMAELVFVLPNKHTDWYRNFIKALLETESGMAEKIDKK